MATAANTEETKTRTKKSKQEWIQWLQTCPDAIEYTTDAQYRAHLRSIFGFSPEAVLKYTDQGLTAGYVGDLHTEDRDEVTADEMRFDNWAMTVGLAQWFEWTEDDPNFLELYTHASYKMITINPEVGQCVLCSFDQFAKYYTCVRTFLTTGKHHPWMFALLREFAPSEDARMKG